MKAPILFAPAALLGLGVLLVSGIREQHTMAPAQPLANIPAVMLGLPSHDVEIGQEERRIAGMSHFVLRGFIRDSADAFTVYVGYYDRQVQGKTIHSPKNCLPGAGWEILSAERIDLPGTTSHGTANRVLLSNRNVRALVLYWYQGRGREESSEYRVKWDLLRDAMRYGRTEEALVRIVVPVTETGATSGKGAIDAEMAVLAADKLARAVAMQLTPAVGRVLPEFPGT